MKTQLKIASVAVMMALAQLPLAASAQPQKAPAATNPPLSSAPTAPAAKAPITAKAPIDWIIYDDTTYTPVLDDVTDHLATARSALTKKDNVKASEAMTAAARALEVQAEQAAKIDRQRAAADMKLARDTHAKIATLAKKLYATADQIKAGKVPTTAALEKILDKASRADLERRWFVTDVTTWYPVAEEPQRHFFAAAAAYAKKDYKAAATEVRKAESYVRLESERAIGDAKIALDTARARLDKTAKELDKGAIKTEKEMDRVFADANHALALAHRAKAAESWAHKAYDQTGYELKSAAHGLESAATWVGREAAGAAAAAAVGDARAVGDKLASGGVWARDEVSKGFESLGAELNKLGESIGSKSKAAPFDVGK